jgi:methionyl-tRNA formyltransferase
MRVVFMGTPSFAVPTLSALHEAGYDMVSIVTQPDRPVGRGQRLTPPPVKTEALERALPVYQPRRIKSPEALAHLEQAAAEAIVVVGYGQLIPRTILDLPRLGCINVHASLLPKYRGAAPMQWAIANGETLTGVTTMLIEERLDAGDMLLRQEVQIGPQETTPELAARLAPIGAALLLETLRQIAANQIAPLKQKEEEATFAPLLKREDGWIDWTRPATEIANRIRGFEPWPGGYTSFRGKRLHLRKARASGALALQPARVSLADGHLRASCGAGTSLLIEEVQLEGRNRVTASDFMRGYQPKEEETLGEIKL